MSGRTSPLSLSASLLLLILLPSLLLAVESFSGKCISIADGDTIGVLKDGREIKIRVDGIDCPESGQDFGGKAKSFTSDFCFGKQVFVRAKGLDKYGRTIARVIVDDKDLSLELVRTGLAWHYAKYSSDSVLAGAERIARLNGKGLWALINPLPPWDFRAGGAALRDQFDSLKESDSTYQGKPVEDTTTVYITKTGAKYHRSGCRYLRKSSISISKSNAIARGYTPCSKCRP